MEPGKKKSEIKYRETRGKGNKGGGTGGLREVLGVELALLLALVCVAGLLFLIARVSRNENREENIYTKKENKENKIKTKKTREERREKWKKNEVAEEEAIAAYK